MRTRKGKRRPEKWRESGPGVEGLRGAGRKGNLHSGTGEANRKVRTHKVKIFESIV